MKTIPAIEKVLDAEGGYVNDPADKGGETNWGITVATARAQGYAGEMKNLTRQEASTILEHEYWISPGFDKVSALSESIALELCDTGVNMGPSVATRWLQRWLNALNKGNSEYQEVPVDGNLGDKSIDALGSFLTLRGKEGEQVLVKALNCSQGQRYLELAEERKANETFIYGWIRERVSV